MLEHNLTLGPDERARQHDSASALVMEMQQAGERVRRVASGREIRTVPRMSDLLSRITVEPGKCGGRPCIRGYRMRVKDVLELLAHGASWEEILTDYPFLEADDLRACLEFAAAQNDHVLLHAAAS